ncbi:MAG: methylmalonyl-CoA decarboxylase [Chthoniobacterales bacterium]|jgi:methylmalonyl-CoA decarboxylase|nr:methylmalonyl-CoA decarboxylase [Chthoniobacterales bacterium]
MALIECSLREKTGVLTLNRPDKQNSLNRELMQELMTGIGALVAQDVHVLVIRAAPGAKVWSSGHDINELPEPRRDPLACFDALETLLRTIQDCPLPVIAMVEGSVWGGACDLCFSCDLVVAARGSSFAMTPAKLGIPYNASGLIHFTSLIGVNKAKEMFFTAQPVPVEDAWNNGLVNHVVPADELEDFTLKMAATIAANAPLAVRALKKEFRLLMRGHSIDAETADRIEAIRRKVYDSDDYAEGIRAFKEKRPPRFTGK